MKRWAWFRLVVSVASIVATTVANDDIERPIQVFILAGQSNMVGHGSIDHLDSLIANETTRADFDILWDKPTRRYRTRNDVYIKNGLAHGKLAVSRSNGYAAQNSFGPEVMFGWTIADAATVYPQQTQSHNTTSSETTSSTARVLLIKTAWGGKSLAVDFRPPSAGQGNVSGVVDPTQYGQFYRAMIRDIQETLGNMTQYIPNYDIHHRSYELAGFLWFQGWNDVLRWDMVHEYELNLARFIRDIRLDLATPNLPFVIGELGMHGVNPKGTGAERVLALRAAQRNVTLKNEFCRSTLFVRTAQYAVLNGTVYNGIHHYNGRADTYFYMSHAMGKGMLQLIENIKTNSVDQCPVGSTRAPMRAPIDSPISNVSWVVPTKAPEYGTEAPATIPSAQKPPSPPRVPTQIPVVATTAPQTDNGNPMPGPLTQSPTRSKNGILRLSSAPLVIPTNAPEYGTEAPATIPSAQKPPSPPRVPTQIPVVATKAPQTDTGNPIPGPLTQSPTRSKNGILRPSSAPLVIPTNAPEYGTEAPAATILAPSPPTGFGTLIPAPPTQLPTRRSKCGILHGDRLCLLTPCGFFGRLFGFCQKT